MDFKILDTKEVETRTWVLAKGNLFEYLSELKNDFYNFSIQRKIVKNQYLDSILSTIVKGDPIPILTITYNKRTTKFAAGKSISIDLNDVEILDGLQRTFRLWTYYKIIEIYKESKKKDPVSVATTIRQKLPMAFDTAVITYTEIKNLIADEELESLESTFKRFDLYFIIWYNLSPQQVINKMLILNAGQRSVTKTHQYELLFLYLWHDLENRLHPKIHLYREKDFFANDVKAGQRSVGDYQFSSVIVGLRSYLEERPLKISVDINTLATDPLDDDTSINEQVFKADFIESFLHYLRDVDEVINSTEGAFGKKWFVRETTLVGILAGLGTYLEISELNDIKELRRRTDEGFKQLKKKSKSPGYKLNDFQNEYNNLYNKTVNVGTFVRKAIKDYTLSLLRDETPSWKKIFNQA
jgi:hypothetical protein